MTDQTNKLEPCPFCGSTVDLWGTEDTGYFLACNTNGCYGSNTAKHGGHETVAAWNRRASAPADILRMRQQLEQEWCELQKLKASYASAPAAPMVDMVPPATSRDRWMYEQGRLAERDPRTPGSLAARVANAPAATCPNCPTCPPPNDEHEAAEREHMGCAHNRTGIYGAPAAEDAKAAYVRAFGSDEGWLGEPGSWFIEGYRAKGAPAAGSMGRVQDYANEASKPRSNACDVVHALNGVELRMSDISALLDQCGSAAAACRVPKDHEVAATVNRLRDIAVEFHGSQQLRERIAGEVRALLAQYGNPAWQPIETAPKDGTTILIGRDMRDFGFVRGYGRFEGTDGAYISGWVSSGFIDPPGNLGLAHPTHWMPLPPAPQEGK